MPTKHDVSIGTFRVGSICRPVQKGRAVDLWAFVWPMRAAMTFGTIVWLLMTSAGRISVVPWTAVEQLSFSSGSVPGASSTTAN